MIKFILLAFIPAFISLGTFCQGTILTQKECRISTGFGFAGATKNMKSAGPDVWVQFDYKVSQNFSVATEFENMGYKQKGYYMDIPVSPNVIKVYTNNFPYL